MGAMSTISSTARGWLVALCALALVVGTVAVTGGFEPARSRVKPVAVGDWIELTRWDVRVDDCVVVPDEEPGEPADVMIGLTVVNTWNESQYGFGDHMAKIILPNGETFGARTETFSMRDAERMGDFDPGFERPATLRVESVDYPWPAETVAIRLGTETQRDGFILSGSWVTDVWRVVVEVECPVGAP